MFYLGVPILHDLSYISETIQNEHLTPKLFSQVLRGCIQVFLMYAKLTS